MDDVQTTTLQSYKGSTSVLHLSLSFFFLKKKSPGGILPRSPRAGIFSCFVGTGACGSPTIALECRLGLGPNFAPHCEGWMDGSLDAYHYCMGPLLVDGIPISPWVVMLAVAL